METAPLKSFATWARTTLISEVSARLAVVLAPGSTERVEHPNAVTELERAIKAAGGGDAGQAAVAEKVAYTWFNRIIALRFMDANGFTGGVGVVSPERGKATGQPEVLADAKRGTLDSEVVRPAVAQAVTNLLDGTRPSTDPQGEAYALLLAEYCRHWHKAMPFMFEREGDYTELLIPSNLLADESVMSRAVEVLTEEVCADVEVIGWLYQFYISERKDEVFAGFKKNKKAGAAEIPAATQLFTPHWIVRYLVENSVGRLWLLNRPESPLAEQMDYYIAPVDEETDFLRIDSPEELSVIDPACGSGHMLTYAFDLLYLIYEEEGYAPSDIPALILEKNLFGVEIDPRAGALAAFALTMKARRRQRTFFAKEVEPSICVLEPISFTEEELDFLVTPGGDQAAEVEFWNQFADAHLFGSLIQPDLDRTLLMPLDSSAGGDMLTAAVIERVQSVERQAKFLTSQYAVVVMNPPYMGNKQLDDQVRSWAAGHAPAAKHDLYAMFLQATSNWVVFGGFVAMVAPHTWMFLSRYEQLRRITLSEFTIASLVHLGPRAFETIGGEVVQVAAFSMRAGLSRTTGTYFRLVDIDTPGAKELEFRRARLKGDRHRSYATATDRFASLPGSPVAYWVPQHIATAFADESPLEEMAPARKGMVTARNDVFLRLWFEVSAGNCGFARFSHREDARASGRRWFGYIKGGPARKWWGNLEYVVDWQDDGRRLQTERHPTEDRVWATNFNLDFIFRPNVNWGDVGGSSFAARLSEGGQLFDGTGSACFPSDERILEVLALLNSSSAKAFLEVLNPTMHFLAGDIARIPFGARSGQETPRAIARRAVALARLDWDQYETSWDFETSPLLSLGGSHHSSLQSAASEVLARQADWIAETDDLERRNDEWWLEYYGGPSELNADAPRRSTLSELDNHRIAADLVSYAVGCMFGRYSLDEHGLILANQGDTLAEYLAEVPNPTFVPDADNVIPMVDGDWFEDDIVARFREFLRVAFGEEHFEENLRFVSESLGVKDIRTYFLKSFYADHVKRYKKRPIYWLFSSPKGSFNALIYMHRYTPSTVSTVLNEYLREYVGKLEASRQHHERLAASADTPRARAAAQKEVDRLRKVLLELEEYEHDVLYPLATQQIAIDLDDGVKVNYPKFGKALKKIPGLEARE